VRSQRGQLKRIEDLGAAMEERLILDNRCHTYSHVTLYINLIKTRVDLAGSRIGLCSGDLLGYAYS
jgi:hypothetical protein